jgi:chromate reductase, NAD(P)H dehydrogenase (quinone)
MQKFISIAGSLRKESFNKSIAKALENLNTGKYTVEYKSIDNVPLFNEDIESKKIPEQVIDLAKSIEESSGLIICTPEYNGTYSGVIKNTLDWLSRGSVGSPLRSKPVLIIGSSVGRYGGAIAHEDLSKVANYLGMHTVNFPKIRISEVKNIFDESRNIISDETLKQLQDGLVELSNLSAKLLV